MNSLIENRTKQNLSAIPEEIFEIKELEELDIRDNQIQVGKYEDGNGILNSFDGISDKILQLSNLKKLNLSQNQLKEIPEYLGNLNSLKELNLSNNSIEEIPQSLLNLNLEKLDIRNNPICKIKGLNHNKSPKEIIEFLLFNQDKEKVPLNEAKLLILGDENAGKSSLVERMVCDRFTPEYNSTLGIDIVEWQTLYEKFKKYKWSISNTILTLQDYQYHFNILKSNIKINIWDFAGQEITYQVHNLFMSQESLYLLVVDGQKEDDIVQHFNWLETIGANADYPPIIIVVTKYENNRTYRIDKDLYQKKFNNIVDICYVSSKNGTRIDDLKESIFSKIKELSSIRIPTDCILIKKEIEEKNKQLKSSEFCENKIQKEIDNSILEPSEFRAICNKYGIKDKKERANIRTILNDIGTIIGLDRDDRHVINPIVIIDDIYELIRSKEVTDKGTMPLDDPDDNHQNWIIQFLIKNKIAFNIDESNVMIPSRLPVNRPNDFTLRNYEGSFTQKEDNQIFEQGLNYRFRYIHGFKRGLFFDFIINIYDDIKEFEPEYWANGICWRENNIDIAILFNRIYKTIDIHIPTFDDNSRILFSKIRKEFRKINKDDNIFAIEEVAVFKDDQIVKYISYDFLSFKKDRGDSKVEIEIHQKPYNYNLLDLVDRYEYIEDEVIDDSLKPLIITEGKTDCRYLENALERLKKEKELYHSLDIKFDYAEGDAEVKRMLQTYCKTKQLKKYIFMFDRDNKDIVKEYGNKEFNSHGNSVYSFCIPKISNKLDKICIEFYYKKEDLKTKDDSGRRIFLGEEFLPNGNSKCGRYITSHRNSKELDILDRDKKVYRRDDIEWRDNIALSKDEFSMNIKNGVEKFNNFNIDKFQLIFNVIEKIINKDTSSLTNIQELIDNYNRDIVKIIQAMQNGDIENFEEIKVELAQELKKIMQENPKNWTNAKQKALKRKEYIESLLKEKEE